jgi:hypothetical protein
MASIQTLNHIPNEECQLGSSHQAFSRSQLSASERI